MLPAAARSDAAARGAGDETLLDQERLDHILDRTALFAHRGRQIVHADRAAFEFLDDREQQFAVQRVEAQRVDFEHVERRHRDLRADEARRLDLGEIPHPPQKSIGDSRRAARALRDSIGPVRLQTQFQYRRAADDDALEIRHAVELEPLDDAESITQRRSQQSGASRRTDQRERRQIQLDGAGPGALADHQIELVILQCRIQHLLDDRTQAMNFVDEQHVARLQVREQSGQIAGLLEDRAGSLTQIDVQFVGDDVCERRLAEAGRSEDQDVIQRLAAIARRLDENAHLRFYLGLADVLGQRSRAYGTIDDLVVAPARSRDDAILFDSHWGRVRGRRLGGGLRG